MTSKPTTRNSLLIAAMTTALITSGAQAEQVTTATGAGFDGSLCEVNYGSAYDGGFYTNDAGKFRNNCYQASTRHYMTVFKFDLSGVTLPSTALTNVQFKLTVNGSTGTTIRTHTLAEYTGDDTLITTSIGYNAANPFIDDAYVAETNTDTDFAAGTVSTLLTFPNVAGGNVQYVGDGDANLKAAVTAALAPGGDKTLTLIMYGGSNQFLTQADEDPDVADRPTLILFGDSDSDGLDDEWENTYFGDLDEIGTGDPDSDGYDNEAEETAGSNPTDPNSNPGDSDADGLADAWENTYFGDLSQTGTGDPDLDGYTNEEEETAGTIPTDHASFIDTDSDGLNDLWETTYFLGIGSAETTTSDPDSDGYNNAAEYAAFTDPTNPLSIPGDSDADGVPDLWEDQYFGNNDGIIDAGDLTGTDGTGDPDSDGFTDIQEATVNLANPVASDPNNANSIPGDSDGDGLSDVFELDYFPDIYGQNGEDDSDGDLYTNEEEENAGTSPIEFYDFVDSDSDGINDKWEILYYGNLTTTEDIDDDTDSDGYTSDDEYFYGSDPTNPLSIEDDIDGDGLSDTWEGSNFPSGLWNDFNWGLLDQSAGDDPDYDGATNAEEEAAGTNPFDNVDGIVARYDAADAPDSDSDGLGDAWELKYFTDLTTTEAGTDDNDSDGEDNATEFANLTDPTDPLSTSDTDGDRLPDGWENANFGDLSQTGAGDFDSDGASNLFELRLGTNPNDGGSVPSPDSIDTNNLLGADIDLWNDTQNNIDHSGWQLGGNNDMVLRTSNTSRIHIPMLRFDLRNVSGDLSDAVLRLTTTFEINNDTINTINVWGLVDGSPGEDWDELTTSYDTAPGLVDPSINNVWSRMPGRVKFLGTMQVTNVGENLSDPERLDLSSFIADDTDGQITLFFSTQDPNHWTAFSCKENNGGTGPAPTLLFPGGITLNPDSDSDGLADTWEIDNFGDLDEVGTGDPDSDGVDNETEETFGTDPNNPADFPADTDGDGLADAWEIDNFGDLDEVGTGDPDSDGFDNEAEETGGSDPNVAASTPLDTDADNLPDAWEIANFGGISGPVTVVNTSTPVTVASAATADGAGVLFTSASFNMGAANVVAIVVTSEGLGSSVAHSMTFAGQPMNEVWAAEGVQSAAIYYLVNPSITEGQFVHTVDAGDDSNIYAYSAISLSGALGFADSDTAASTSSDFATPVEVSYTTGSDGGFVIGAVANNGTSGTHTISVASGNPDTDLIPFVLLGTSGHFAAYGDVASAGSYTDGYLGQYQRTAISTVAFDGAPSVDPLGYDGSDDPDSDGYDNAAEFAAGTDPNNNADYPGAGAPALGVGSVSFDTATNTFTINVTGMTVGNWYEIQSSTTLSGFTIVGSPFQAATADEVRNVPANEEADPKQFFRVADSTAPAP